MYLGFVKHSTSTAVGIPNYVTGGGGSSTVALAAQVTTSIIATGQTPGSLPLDLASYISPSSVTTSFYAQNTSGESPALMTAYALP